MSRESAQLRAIIVDDEPIARRVLREELELMDGVEIAGEADSGARALELIAAAQPDIVLLDLEMPGMNGFEVVRSLQGSVRVPVIIVVTAFDQHAVQAFEAGAIDYLLKPVGHERLAVAIDRARRLRKGPHQAAEHLARLQEIAEERTAAPARRKIAGKLGEEYVLLNADEVFAFQADGDLVWIVTAGKRYLATQTLRGLEERLSSANFRRVHRNALVNMDHVRKMSPMSSQRWLITLSNNLEFIVSKRLAHTVRQLLSW